MRILLLGSTGFLGGHTAEQLRALPGVRLLVGGRSADARSVERRVGEEGNRVGVVVGGGRWMIR
ncbi:hypothetical protein ABZS89_36265, partial [Streptomyces sp. NPDC005407]